MTLRELLRRCEQSDVKLTVIAPGRLSVDAPHGVLNRELCAALLIHKPALLAMMRLEGEALRAEQARFAAWEREHTPPIPQSAIDAVEAVIRGHGRPH